MVDHTVVENPRMNLMRAALLPALATALTWTPTMFMNTAEPLPTVLVVLLFVSAPAVALIVNWRRPAATDGGRATYTAIPQVFVLPAMVWLDIWLAVQSGEIKRGSSDEAMSYGGGITLAVIVGVILMWLVGGAGRLGSWLEDR